MTIPQNGSQILPGWTLYFNEVSNGVYKVVLTDDFGRQASTSDQNIYHAIKTCEEYAFDIEKQISKNWGRFLFDYSMVKLRGVVNFANGKGENAYGSWSIRVKDNMLSYEGRDDILMIKNVHSGPFDSRVVGLSEVSFATIVEYLGVLQS